MIKKEFSILDSNIPIYYNTRLPNTERHEIFEGRTGNRDKSIEDGLVIFLTSELHRTGKYAIHKNPKFWKEQIKIQEIAEKRWCEYYKKTPDDFLKRYGRNYL